MGFAILPPEINTGRIYAGPGSAPLMAVAAAWDCLADDLYTTANADHAAISELTDQAWTGPTATAMAAAAAPFVEWTVMTAVQAQQAATQARAAAAAFDTAFAMTVPPPVITANRSLLRTLIATNILGQKTSQRSQPLRPTTPKCGRKTPPRCSAMPQLRRPRRC